MMGRFILNLACFIAVSLFAGAQLMGQSASLSGVVNDEEGQPLSGAVVMLQGTDKGSLTDEEGLYSIGSLAPGTYTVQVSYVTYVTFTKSVTVEAGQAQVLNVQLELEAMDDVVIVGYGSERKRNMTGSVSKITSRELNDIPGTSFEATLQGKAAGVQVIQSSGMAGAGAVVRVRGVGSISAGGDPLYVIDGIPVTQDPFLNGDRGGQNNNPLASINPADIESIEILKDAAAAAIYGSRGANGVVLITTKRGKKGEPVFNLSVRGGLSKPTRLQEFLTTEEWVQLYQEAWENDGNVGTPDFLPGGYTIDSALANGTTNWQDQTVGTGFKQEYNLSMTQGGKRMKTYAAISAMDNESYLLGNSYTRYTGRLNMDFNLMKNLKAGISSFGSYGRNNKISQAWEGGLGTAQSTALPYYPIDAPNNVFGSGNPITRRTSIDWRTIEQRTINSANIEYRPTKDLSITLNGSYDYMNMGDHYLEDTVWTNWYSVAKNYRTRVNNWNTNGLLRYDFSMLPEKHDLNFMAGMEAQKSVTTSGYMEVSDVSQHLYLDWEGTENSDTIDVVNPNSAWSFVSWFGRANYMFNDRLILKASLRVDGSSKFGENNRYGYFPAAGVGYILSEEQFWKDNLSFVNFFKLKASYGVTGNADIPPFLRFGTFSSGGGNIQYNGDTIIFPIRLDNPDLSWETTTTVDAGFEFGILQDRINGEFAFYNKESRDVLLETSTQASTGFQKYWQNIGQVRNQGVEFGITSRNLVGRFKWTTELNIARNVNTVIDIGTTAPDALAGSGDTRVIPGEPVGVNYLVRFSHVDAESGLPVFLDKDGNETFEWTEDNRVVVGNVQPDFQGGLRNYFEFDNFDLNVLWTFSVGGMIYDDAAKRQLGVVSDWNMRRDIINRWTGPGDADAEYPRLTLDPTTYGGMGSYWFYNTTQWLYDASYARLKIVTLGYTMDLSTEQKSRQLRVYASGTNLVTLTNYPGSDPEIVRDHNGPQGRNISPNVTYLTPPQERTISIGVDIQF